MARIEALTPRLGGTVDDADLLDLIASDNAGGIALVMDKYGSRLLGRLYRYAADRRYGNSDVEDVFQDALLLLFDPQERAKLVSDGGQILPWLTKWGQWRLDDRRRHQPVTSEVEELPDTRLLADQTDETVAISRQVEGLRVVWDWLSGRDRLLLSLRYEENRSEASIAAHFGISNAAAKKALHDARSRLSKFLRQEGFDVEE